MTAPTITIAGPGAVPAIPENLHDVALAAQKTPARTWSVIVTPDGGDPVLYASELPNSVAAGQIAQHLVEWYGPAVFVAYRCPTAVTLHGPHPELAHNLIGTMPVGPTQTTAPAAQVDLPHLIAHVHQLAAGLHDYAIAEHRREHTHRIITA